MKQTRLLLLPALAAALTLYGCSASAAHGNLPQHPAQASWGTYQFSADRNAVLTGYSIPHDWSYDAKANINSGLALVGNTLLFTAFSRRLIALDVRTGRELWHAQLPNIVMSTPIVAGDTVYVGTGKSGILNRNWNPLLKIRFAGKDVWGVPAGDEIAAFDLHSGKLRWIHRTVGEDMPSPVYDRGRLIFANGDWHAYALRANDGRQLWSSEVGGISTMASALHAGKNVVVTVCARGLHKSSAVALDEATGKIRWTSPYGYCDATPAYANGEVFLSSAKPGETGLQPRSIVAALNAQTGKPLWVYRQRKQGLWSIVGSAEAAVSGSYANGTYYQSLPFSDELIAFDAASGKIRWRFHTSGPVKMSPVVSNGRLYVGDTAGLLYTLDSQNGRLLELREFHKPFTTSPPIVAGNKLLIANSTTVNAIPLSGRPEGFKGIGWAITPYGLKMNETR